MLRSLRRRAHALAVLVLIQVAIPATMLACVPAEPHQPVSSAEVAEGRAAHAHHAAAPDTDTRSNSQMPDHGTRDCVATMNCVTVAVPSHTACDVDVATVHGVITTRVAERPASILGAPEPPPPRA